MFSTAVYANTDTIAVKEVSQPTSITTKEDNGMLSNLMGLLPMVLIFFVFYLFVIRPQNKKKVELEKMVQSVKKGEKVLTHAGIYGVVSKVNEADNSIELEIAESVVVRMPRNAVSDIISRHKQENASAKDTKPRKQGRRKIAKKATTDKKV